MKIKALSTAIATILCAPALAATSCPTLIDEARQVCTSQPEASLRECLVAKIPAECVSEMDHMLSNALVLPRQTVIGTRFGIDVDKYPGSVSVLGQEDMDFSTDIIRALSKVPGFDTGNDMGRNMGQSFTIRGFGHGSESRVIVMQDGVRRSANLFSNQVSSFRMDTDLLKQVEVVRGASSISHGGGAIGGVIGSTTKDASDYVLPGRETGLQVKYRHDSNNSNQYSAAFAYAPESRPFELLAFAKVYDKGDIEWSETLHSSNGTRYNSTDNDEHITTYFFKGGVRFNDENQLKLSYNELSNDFFSGWNSLYHYEFGADTGAVVGTLMQKDTVLSYTSRGASPWLDLSISAYQSESYSEKGYEYGIDLYYRNADERKGINAQNLMTFSTGNINHRLVIGMDYEHRQEDAIYILNGVQSDFNSMPNDWKDLGIFIQHESRYWNDRIALQLGGRYDQFDREVMGVEETYDNSRFSPRVGASFEVAEGFNLLANYSETFRAPTPHETSSAGPLNIHYWYQPNPNLKSETAKEVEGGFSWHGRGLLRDDDRFRVKAMYFTGRIEDMIELVIDHEGPLSPANSKYVRYENVGLARRNGVEVEASYDREHWGAFLTYEQLDQFDRKTHRKTPYAFADRARFGMSFTPFADDFTLSFDVTHWFAPDQNPETVMSGGQLLYYVNKSFSQSNVQMRWRPFQSYVPFLDGSTEILFGINNVFEQKRLPASGVMTSTRVGEGRNIYVSLSKTF